MNATPKRSASKISTGEHDKERQGYLLVASLL